MRDALQDWFERAARPLPWRDGRRDAYRTLVVEVLSQQTRIATVEARLPGFLARFPDLATLAAADLDEVLAVWSGLGYYRRARALHALARAVVADHGGRLPREPDALQRLPGIGPYTATALAAQAFGVPGVAVDGNVRRVGARLLAAPDPSDREVRSALTALLWGDEPHDGQGAFVAEALVELGATVCTPRAPACPECPLRPGCRGAADGDPTRYPAPRRRTAPRPWTLHAWLVVDRDADGGAVVAVERRADRGPWAGLHGPPWRDEPPPDAEPLARFVHRLSHRTIDAHVWRASAPPEDADVRWLAAADLAGLGTAEIDRRAFALVAATR
ncbi:MAG: NUDIX domain-containing protein [Trueperaceae bacterium]|nr:NUDIX domain-containing protein [Trueperaceae bacterium]